MQMYKFGIARYCNFYRKFGIIRHMWTYQACENPNRLLIFVPDERGNTEDRRKRDDFLGTS